MHKLTKNSVTPIALHVKHQPRITYHMIFAGSVFKISRKESKKSARLKNFFQF